VTDELKRNREFLVFVRRLIKAPRGSIRSFRRSFFFLGDRTEESDVKGHRLAVAAGCEMTQSDWKRAARGARRALCRDVRNGHRDYTRRLDPHGLSLLMNPARKPWRLCFRTPGRSQMGRYRYAGTRQCAEGAIRSQSTFRLEAHALACSSASLGTAPLHGSRRIPEKVWRQGAGIEARIGIFAVLAEARPIRCVRCWTHWASRAGTEANSEASLACFAEEKCVSVAAVIVARETAEIEVNRCGLRR